MATRIISTRIAVDGEKEYKQQMSSVNSELKTLKTELSLTEAEFRGQANSVEALTAKDKILRQEVEQQQEKVRALEQAVADATEAYGENDKRTDQWKQSLNRAKTELINLNDQLDDNSRYLDEAKRSSEKTSKSIDEFGKKVKDAGGDLGNTKASMKDFISLLDEMKGMLVGGAVVAGVKELAGAVTEIEESTREYRQILGTLETSSKEAGYTASETSELYENLYGVLGDMQSTATTVANLQAIGLEQDKLQSIIYQVTGAWATYGDSIPIDGLAESINETIKAQQVTGTFADVLNWGTQAGETFGITLKDNVEFTELSKNELDKLSDSQRAQYEATKQQYDEIKSYNEAVLDCQSAEDYFNLALMETSSEAERANLVMEAMAKQGLTQTGIAWRQNNKDIIAANEAQAKWDEAMAGLGETVAPAAEALKSFGADAIVWVTEKIQGAVEWINKAIDAYKSLTSWLNKDSDARLQAGVAAYNARVDGSHASGLARVPYDGYIAELHRDERILTAAESKVWDSIQRGDTSAGSNISVQDLRDVMAASVNAMGAIGQGGSYKVDIHMDIDGKEFYRTTIDDLRAVQKSTPEARDDR